MVSLCRSNLEGLWSISSDRKASGPLCTHWFYCNKATCTRQHLKWASFSFQWKPKKSKKKKKKKTEKKGKKKTKDESYNRECQLQINPTASAASPVSGAQVFIRRVLFKCHLKRQGCLLNVTMKHAKGEAMLSDAHIPPRHLDPTLAHCLSPPFSFFFLFIKQEKVDRSMLVNANCLYSHRDTV